MAETVSGRSRTRSEVQEKIVELRQQWPDWGAPKLLVLLRQQHPEAPAISVRTVHRILERHGLIREADRHRPAEKRFERSAPNELWQMDFKGPQGFNQDNPVGPLSILDDHSRYLVALQHLGSTRMEGVRGTLEQTFQTVGLPDAMLVDHGVPWWNNAGPWGLTELTVWIMRQGVRLLYSGVRHPQTQGKVERMHGALQRAVGRRKADPDDPQWLETFRTSTTRCVPMRRWRWPRRLPAGVPVRVPFSPSRANGNTRPRWNWCACTARVSSAGIAAAGK